MLKVIDLMAKTGKQFSHLWRLFLSVDYEECLAPVVQKWMFKVTELYEVSHLCLNLTLCRNLLGDGKQWRNLSPCALFHSTLFLLDK